MFRHFTARYDGMTVETYDTLTKGQIRVLLWAYAFPVAQYVVPVSVAHHIKSKLMGNATTADRESMFNNLNKYREV